MHWYKTAKDNIIYQVREGYTVEEIEHEHSGSLEVAHFEAQSLVKRSIGLVTFSARLIINGLQTIIQ